MCLKQSYIFPYRTAFYDKTSWWTRVIYGNILEQHGMIMKNDCNDGSWMFCWSVCGYIHYSRSWQILLNVTLNSNKPHKSHPMHYTYILFTLTRQLNTKTKISPQQVQLVLKEHVRLRP